jgi:translation initiation factor IF-3
MGRQYRVNGKIREATVQVVSSEEGLLGVFSIAEALRMAQERDLDLVEVSPRKGDTPSVCKISDFGKLMYEQSKKNKQPRPHTMKEIRCNFRISDHDLEIKNRKVAELIGKKHKVKYSIELRGREKVMESAALQKMQENLDSFSSIATWDKPQLVSGGKRAMISTVLSPKG